MTSPPGPVRGTTWPFRYPMLRKDRNRPAVSFEATSASSMKMVGEALAIQWKRADGVTPVATLDLAAMNDNSSMVRVLPDRFVSDVMTRYGKASKSGHRYVAAAHSAQANG